MFRQFVFRGVLALLLVALLAGGVGWLAYNAGVARGLADSGKVALPAAAQPFLDGTFLHKDPVLMRWAPWLIAEASLLARKPADVSWERARRTEALRLILVPARLLDATESRKRSVILVLSGSLEFRPLPA